MNSKQKLVAAGAIAIAGASTLLAGNVAGAAGSGAACPALVAQVVNRGADGALDEGIEISTDCSSRAAYATSQDEYSPALSPDGQRVAFVRSAGDGGGATLVVGSAVADKVEMEYAPGQALGDPTWSPDGSRIAFWQDNGEGHPGIWIYDLESASASVVSQGDTVQSQPAWAPDGRQVVFTRSDADGSFLVIADTKGETEHVVRSGRGALANASFSPDGESVVAIESDDPMSGRLVTVDTATGKATSSTEVLDATLLDTAWPVAGPVAIASTSELNTVRVLTFGAAQLAGATVSTFSGIPDLASVQTEVDR